jgi:hypothetical protein
MIDSLLLNNTALFARFVGVRPYTIISIDRVIRKIDPCLRANGWRKNNVIIALYIVTDVLLLVWVNDGIDVVKIKVKILKRCEE